jgi:tetratricopeptide (TPR) repeat protein
LAGRAHFAALAAWCAGDLVGACAIWDEIMVEHPTDLLALRLHHFNSFWMGRSAVLRDAVARVLPGWCEDMPGYGSVLGMYAFGLEECGEYVEAEAKGRRAVELNGDDLWAIHAVAHVLEMQGRLRDGMEWLSQPLGAWADRNPFKDHLWWHTALFPLELGEHDRVLDLYDGAVRLDRSDFYLDIQNAASLLLRLELQGVDVGDRWRELADVAESRIDDHVLAFTDLHFMMALAVGDRAAACRGLLASLQDFAVQPRNFAAATMRPVTVPLCEAILAYAEGEYGRAVDLMLPIRYELACIGGSHAQRDIFAQILIEAALRDGRLKLARALLAERLALRPHSRGTWLKYAQVLDGLDDATGAQTARRRSLELE